jgi:hypothetical protein
VRVGDQLGNGVSGIEVSFDVVSGGGSMSRNVATTDSAGIASASSWILGASGINTLRASASGIPSVTALVEVLAMSGALYSLQTITIGSMTRSGVTSAIALSDDGTFVTHVDGLVGVGTYSVSGSVIAFTYSNSFLGELANHMCFYTHGATERGILSGAEIIINRCWTEDCYESTWWVFQG